MKLAPCRHFYIKITEARVQWNATFNDFTQQVYCRAIPAEPYTIEYGGGPLESMAVSFSPGETSTFGEVSCRANAGEGEVGGFISINFKTSEKLFDRLVAAYKDLPGASMNFPLEEGQTTICHRDYHPDDFEALTIDPSSPPHVKVDKFYLVFPMAWREETLTAAAAS